MKLKTGDRVKITEDATSTCVGSGYAGKEVMLGSLYNSTHQCSVHHALYWRIAENYDYLVCEGCIELKQNMNLKESVLLALTKEPFKSLRRAKITNGDDMLTEEGRELFINWLFRENVEKFVADESIKETLAEVNKKEE